MNKAYNPIIWENSPSENTPINEDNLNKMSSAIDIIDKRVVTHETTKANQTDLLTAVADVTFDESTGVFTVTKKNGSSVTIDTKLEKLILNWRFDTETQTLYLVLDDGTEIPIDLSSLISTNEFVNSDRITLTVSADGKVTADIVKGSITGEYLEPNYLANVTAQADSASQSAETAITEADRATTEADRAEAAASKAESIVGGDYATNTKVDAIIDGTTTVGNADKLDGHDSEYFAPKTDLTNYLPLSGGTLTSRRLGLFNGLGEVYADENGVNMATRNDGSIANRSLIVFNSDLISGVNTALRLRDRVDSVDTDYIVLHSGNVSTYALPKTGGNVTGQTIGANNGLGIFYADSNGVNVITRNDASSNSTQRMLLVLNSKYTSTVKNALQLTDRVNGVGTGYTVLHTGNKPSGTYTGNGDATARTIDTGGIGSVIKITSATGWSYIVFESGAIGMNYNSESIIVVKQSEIKFNSGVLTISTNRNGLNTDGATHYYQVL